MGAKERKEKELHERRQLILDKSRDLFFRKGFDDVTIGDICESVEYGRSAVYSLFKSKEEIYFEINAEGLLLLGEYLGKIDPTSADFDSQFILCTELLVDFLFDHRSHYQAVFHFNKSCRATGQSEKLSKRQNQILSQALNPVEMLVKRGIERGYFPAERCRQAVSLYTITLFGLLDHIMADRANVSRNKAKTLCREHASIYLKGLRA